MALGAIAFLLVLYRLIAMPAPSRPSAAAPASSSRCWRPLVAAGGFLKNADHAKCAGTPARTLKTAEWQKSSFRSR